MEVEHQRHLLVGAQVARVVEEVVATAHLLDHGTAVDDQLAGAVGVRTALDRRLVAGGAGEAHAYGMTGLWTASTLNGPSTGADFDGGNGNRTGWGSGPSIDQLVAQAAGENLPYQEAIDADDVDGAYPCGRCRQIMSEFDVKRVIVTAGEGSEVRVHTLDELLPYRFRL